MRRLSIALGFLAALTSAASAASAQRQVISQQTGVALSAGQDGSFAITSRNPAWTFAGKLNAPPIDLVTRSGRDRAGAFRAIEFKYRTSDGAARVATIRVYDERPVVLFELAFVTSGRTSESFPSISAYPRGLHQLSYTGVFGGYSFRDRGTDEPSDGPWVFFDDQANSFIFSPASHYMNASLLLGANGELTSGIVADGEQVPAGFSTRAVLVIEPGINRAFETWGRFLTDLAGKTPRQRRRCERQVSRLLD